MVKVYNDLNILSISFSISGLNYLPSEWLHKYLKMKGQLSYKKYKEFDIVIRNIK